MRIARQLFQKFPPLLALALSVSLFVPGSVYGQTSLSLQAGASLATLGGSDVASADSRIGMRVGASAIFPFSANLDLQFGAAYAAKGATEQELGVDLVVELDYFEIPLLLRLSPSVDGLWGNGRCRYRHRNVRVPVCVVGSPLQLWPFLHLRIGRYEESRVFDSSGRHVPHRLATELG